MPDIHHHYTPKWLSKGGLATTGFVVAIIAIIGVGLRAEGYFHFCGG